MNAMQKYKQSRFRKVTLTTGDVIEVRPFNRADYIAIGDIPNVLTTAAGRKALEEGENGERAKIILDNLPFFNALAMRAVGHCIVTPTFKVVTDRPAHECAEDELHFSLLADDDVSAILSAVQTVSGQGKEAAEAATFRGKHDAAGDTGSAGSALRGESVDVAAN